MQARNEADIAGCCRANATGAASRPSGEVCGSRPTVSRSASENSQAPVARLVTVVAGLVGVSHHSSLGRGLGDPGRTIPRKPSRTSSTNSVPTPRSADPNKRPTATNRHTRLDRLIAGGRAGHRPPRSQRAFSRSCQQQSQLSPRQLSTPSRAAIAAITSAAAGSAHHQPSSAFASSPTRSAIER
jgi:hypothetical protein